MTEGGPNDGVPNAITREIEAWGYGHRKIILVSDGEPAILAVKREVGRLRDRAETVPKETPVGEHQASLAEGAVRRVREQTRTRLSQLETKCGKKIDRSGPAMQWLVRWAAMLVSKFQVGEDGKTAFERIRGRKCTAPIAEFGERVWFKELEDGRGERAKIESKWHEGIWMGHKSRTGEHIIGTTTGTVKAFTVKRRAPEDRWNADEINAVKGTPGRPKPGKRDSRIPVRIRMPETTGEEARDERRTAKSKRVYFKRKDFVEHGFTGGCEGCNRLRDKRQARPHTEECVERMKECLKSSAEGRERLRDAEDRNLEEMARQVEEADREDRARREANQDEEMVDADRRAEEDGRGAAGGGEQ